MTIKWTAFPPAVIATASDTIMGLQGNTANFRFLANSWLFTANNLSDVASPTASFDNISPLTTTGDIIYFDGTNNVRLAIGATNKLLSVVGGIPAWVTNPSPTFLQVQDQAATYAIAAGTANALTLALSPAIGAYADGQYISFKAAANNTGATTIATNGLSAVPLVTNGNAALVGGELLIHGDYMAVYNSSYSAYVLVNSSLDVDITAVQIQNFAFSYAVDTGLANAYVIALTPTVSGYTDGQTFLFKAVHANTGATTLDAGGGAVAIVTNANAALTGGEILANGQYIVTYNSSFTAFVLH
jgi:hypothetical protein